MRWESVAYWPPPARGDVVDLVDEKHVELAGVERVGGSTSRSSDMARGRFSQSMDTMRRGKCFHGLAARPRSRRRSPDRVRRRRCGTPGRTSRPSRLFHFRQRLAGQTTMTRARPMAQDHLLDDEAGLDGLAEPDVIGDEQVDPGHREGPHHGVELVVLDGDPRCGTGPGGPGSQRR